MEDRGDKYWRLPSNHQNMASNNGGNPGEDIVVIHVCDENQQISRDFCCKRNILVQNMKYFQKFLTENENGYDDIDISVHCDVEIFEWLMTYIHEPNAPPKIDKSMIVSILISSEFLQMDSLVELCITQMIQSLNEIIKLPIDLSCISEKLINRMAAHTHPKQLSEIKDRKDKILTKLYKRRVELDFSRKGSASKTVPSYAFVSSQTNRNIAASLTCCRYCGMVYLENYVSSLVCRKSPPSIDFRGRLASRHSSITGWSLTSYLKTLHAGGMGWDSIYWHVWAACIILRVNDVTISALEVDRYTIEPDCMIIMKNPVKEISQEAILSPFTKSTPEFSLSSEEDYCHPTLNVSQPVSLRMNISKFDDQAANNNNSSNVSTTPTLNPNRPPEILTTDIFELICSQMKYIVGVAHKALIQNTMQTMVNSSKSTENLEKPDEVYESLWDGNDDDEDSERDGRRGRSPGRNLRANSMEPRKQTHSLSKLRQSSPAAGTSSKETAGNDNPPSDSENMPDGIAAMPRKGTASNERRSRSTSTKRSSINTLLRGSNNASRDRLRSRGGTAGNAGNETSRSSEPSSLALSPRIEHQRPQDEFTLKQHETLKSLPPDLYYRIAQHRVPIHSVWMTPSPLQLIPQALEDMLNVVAESSVPDNKKLEWELDLMREYDEKKMDRLERYLISKRNPAVNQSVLSMKGKRGGGGGQLKSNNPLIKPGTAFNSMFTSKSAADQYYKDRGRQPVHSIN